LFVYEHTQSSERWLIKTDETDRSKRHWSWWNHRVTDTFCNCIEDRTTGSQTHWIKQRFWLNVWLKQWAPNFTSLAARKLIKIYQKKLCFFWRKFI